MTASGFLLFDKPAGRTSFSAIGGFRKTFPGSRVGHTGTLDSFATGLLLVVVGSYSHLTPWFTGLDKTYEAEIQFGLGTDTLDPNGIVTSRGEIPSRTALEEALPAFRGRISQTPPEYSAVHVEGKRASDLARKGRPLELPSRQITISGLDLLSFEGDKAVLGIHCSSGTYVRALARDLAAACGTCAHVTALRRSAVGIFSVLDAIPEPDNATVQSLRLLDPETARSLGMGTVNIGEDVEKAFRNGAPYILPSLESTLAGDGDIAVFSSRRRFLGVVESRSGRRSYKLVLPKDEYSK